MRCSTYCFSMNSSDVSFHLHFYKYYLQISKEVIITVVLKQINTPRFFAMLFKHFEIHFSLLLNLHMKLIKQKATITVTKD